jgi:hypothetical protein
VSLFENQRQLRLSLVSFPSLARARRAQRVDEARASASVENEKVNIAASTVSQQLAGGESTEIIDGVRAGTVYANAHFHPVSPSRGTRRRVGVSKRH